MEVPACKFITAAEDTLDNSSLSLFNDSLNSGSPRKPSEMLNDSLCIDEDDMCLFPTDNTLNPMAVTAGLPSSSQDNLPLSDQTIQNPSQNSLTKVNVSESASSSQNSGSSSPLVFQNRITPMFGKRKLTKRPPSQNHLSDATKKLNNTTNTNNDMSDNESECSQLATIEDHSTKENVNTCTNSGIINKPSFLKTKESKKKATMEKPLKLSKIDKTNHCIEKPVKLNKKEKQERKELKEMEKKEKERIKAEKKLALEKKKAEQEQKKMEKDLKKMERQKNKDEKKGKNEKCTTEKSDVTSKEKGKVNEVTSNEIEDEIDENVDKVCNDVDNEKDNDDSLHNDIAETTIKLLKDNESIDEVNDDLEEKDEAISDELINRESSFNKDMSDNDTKLPLRGERDLEGSQKDECLTNKNGGCEDDSSVESMSLSKSQESFEEMQLEKASLPDSKSVDKSCVCITKTVKKHIFHKKPVFKIPKEKSSNKLPKDKRKRDTAASKQAKKFKSMSSSSCKPSSVWVQCDHPECLKWRLLRNVTDPTKLPDKWYCSMNEDTRYNCCKSNEESWSDPGDNMEFIYSPYNLGSIVLAKLESYPWWPAMIDNDPDQNCYYESSSTISPTPVRYHVVFFDKPVSRGWIHSLNIRPLTEEDSDYDEVPVKYKGSLAVAMEQARKALCLTTVERLDKYGFKALYKRDRKRKFKFADDDGE